MSKNKHNEKPIPGLNLKAPRPALTPTAPVKTGNSSTLPYRVDLLQLGMTGTEIKNVIQNKLDKGCADGLSLCQILPVNVSEAVMIFKKGA